MSSSVRPHPIGVLRARGLLLAVLSLPALAATAGCGVGYGQFSDSHTRRLPVTEIHLSGGSGDVTVSPGAAGETRVDRTVRYWGRNRPAASTWRIDGTVLTLDTSCGSRCGVSYRIRVPRPVAVSGGNGSGAVRLTAVSSVDLTVGSGGVDVTRADGPVRVRTGSGAITLSGLNGDVTARTSSGSIRASALRADRADLRTSSGRIALVLAAPGEVRARTSSGAIEVRVPGGVWRVDASTSSGHVTVDVPTDPAAPHALTLHSSSGNITVRPI